MIKSGESVREHGFAALDQPLGWRSTGDPSRSTFAPYPELLRYERGLG
jgi:hypothetical protein